MAVPKKKTSKAKKKMRRSHHALAETTLAACSNCGAPKRPHRACLECGVYKGVQVIDTDTK